MATSRFPKTRSPRTGFIGSLKNKAGTEFAIGDKVRLKPRVYESFVLPRTNIQETFAGQPITEARIIFFFPDIKGLVIVTPRLGGYWTWEIGDIEKANQRKEK